MRSPFAFLIVLAALVAGSAAAQTLPPLTPGASSSAPLPTISAAQCAPAQCAQTGGFAPVFVEPVIYTVAGTPGQTGGIPVTNPLKQTPTNGNCAPDPTTGAQECKPAGTSMANLPDGRIMFYNNLEGTENIEFSILIEGGGTLINDQSRVLTMDQSTKTATWTVPGPPDGGAAEPAQCLLPGCVLNTGGNPARPDSGSLFCSDLVNLYDGRVMAVGGTNYFAEPGVTLTVDQSPFALGLAELQGLRAARIFDENQNGWAQTGSMNFARWYPSLTSLGNGDVEVFGGVTKLVKPIYPSNPLTSGQNVVNTETFHLYNGTWTDNGATAQRSLPLFPRMHLLPNGQILFGAGGQAFSPAGESIDQPLWNIVAAYDPMAQSWTDLAYAGMPLQLNTVGAGQIVNAIRPSNPLAALTVTTVVNSLVGQTLSNPGTLISQLLATLNLGSSLSSQINTAIGSGMRGSTFDLMLPLTPDAAGNYTKAQFLIAGGTLTAVAATNPGTFVATTLSRIDTIDLSGGTMAYSSQLTSPMNQPRWYGTPALLPTGKVMLFSGSSDDEVVTPGLGNPVMITELFDPNTQTWTRMAEQNRARTYHNTVLLLQDGSVLVGGHAPINTGYLFNFQIPGSSPDGRDPSFEIYYPPYMFGARPAITAAPTSVAPGSRFTVSTPQARAIDSVVLMRRTAITHDVDGDQRSVVLPFTVTDTNTLAVAMTANQSVTPPGAYMLFINQKTPAGLVPSVSAPVVVTGAALTQTADVIP